MKRKLYKKPSQIIFIAELHIALDATLHFHIMEYNEYYSNETWIIRKETPFFCIFFLVSNLHYSKFDEIWTNAIPKDKYTDQMGIAGI